MRKQLVRPDRPQLPAEDAYRFRHLLIRDAAYDALPKSVRADLHRRFAQWLEANGQDIVELEEILGYHLEQAARYLVELGRPDEGLAAAAAAKLAAAGRRATWRLDRRAALSLLQRASALSEDPDVHIVVALARLIDPHTGAQLLDGAAERAEREGDAASAALARAAAGYNRTWIGQLSADEQEHLALAALPLLEAANDNAGLAEVWRTLAQGVYNTRCAYAQMEHASLQARRCAMLAGEPARYGVLSIAFTWGPRPAPEALRILESVIGGTDRHPGMQLDLAVLIAMTGRLDDARSIAQAAEHELHELGDESSAHIYVADIEAIAGNHDIAADRLRRECVYMRARGLKAALGTYTSMLARALCLIGEFDEAELSASEGRENAEEVDPVAQALWRQVTALALSQKGSHADAERFAREAVEYIGRSDGLWARGDALSDLALVLETAGRREDAVGVLREALAVYEQKGIVPIVHRTRERLAILQAA